MERDRELRERLVAHLERSRVLTEPAVKAALLAVPRHLFVPGLSLDDAYDDRAIAVKERDGVVISSISQPAMIAHMLQLLDVRAGESVLEIGTGTGYNAALLQTLAGPEGRVVSVDIEADLLSSAAAHLDAAGFGNVRLVHARDVPSLTGAFDRLIVTARVEDVDAHWWRLLADGGRAVIPIDIGYGGERAIGFHRDGQVLRSYGSYACAFLTLRDMPAERRTETFFPNKRARYAAIPATAPMTVVAMQRRNANDSLIDGADVVVARAETIFALTLSQRHD